MHSSPDDKLRSPSGASAAGRNQPELESDSHSDDDDEVSRSGKRKRLISVSCEICKQRKVKCDRGQPSCGWCARNGAVCEYKERKRPGLRAGFGKELQERMDKLEAILKSHSDIIQAHITPNASALPVAAASIRNSNPSLPSDIGTPRDHPSIYKPSEPASTPQADLSGFPPKTSFSAGSQSADFNLPSTPGIHDSLRNQMHMSGSSASVQLPPIQSNPGLHEYYGSQTPSMQPATGTLPPGGASAADQDMPPYDLLYALVDLFFKHINSWCPILHRKTTLDSLFGPSTFQETDRILLHAIVATTMRYSTDPRLTEERRQHYHQVSKERVLLYGMENSSVQSLQALVILALDLCGSSNGPPGWNIMALITRSVVQLGLAVETNSFSVSPNYKSIYTLRAMVLPEPKDFIEDESRRRLFWMIYLLDRYATIATAFEFALADKEIDRTLPCRDDLWVKNEKVDTKWFKTRHHHGDQPEKEISQPENLGAFAYYIEILGILSKIHQFLKQPVDISALSDVEQWQLRYKELDNELTQWKFGLPSEFGNMSRLFQPGIGKNMSCTWIMLHATYHTAIIRLHSSAAYPTTRSPIFAPSYSASQRCHSAVENIAALGEFVVNNGMLSKLGPPFAFTIWVSARLLLVHGSTVERNVSPQISVFVQTLREMGRYWPVAARYCGLLQRVLDEYADSERQGGGVTPSSVRILADMRRTAFDLDFLISRQPRQGATAPNLQRVPSLTPARTPAPNELEYLDVFDFFNMPRLPFGQDNGGLAPDTSMEAQNGSSGQPLGPLNEFNITNFIVDANSDWLFKQEEKTGPDTKRKWPLWKKLAIAGVVLVVVIGLAVGLGVGLTRNRDGEEDGGVEQRGGGGGNGDDTPSNGTSARASVWRPKAGTTWQIVLKNPVDLGGDSVSRTQGLAPDVDVYDLDMYENTAATFRRLHEAGKKVMCYFSAGSYEDWRADKGEFRDGDLGRPLRGWAGERWVKLSSDNVRRIMGKRIEEAARKGCDAIDPDNVDGYENDNGLGLTANDSVSFVTFLQGEAARHNMSMGLKNAGAIVPRVLHLADFSVNEQCVEEGECATFAPFVAAGKPVFHIEYPDGAEAADGGRVDAAAADQICGRKGKAKGAEGFSTVMKRMDLDGWVQYCDGKVEHPAEEAFVTGTFDNWQKTVKLEKKDGVFQQKVDIAHPSHKIYYKFVVDNNWTINESSPHEPDSDGNVNNFLTQADLEQPTFSSAILNTVTPESSTVAMAGKKNNKKKQQQKAQQAAVATKAAETTPAETTAAAAPAAEVPVEVVPTEPTAPATTTTAVVAPAAAVVPESREETATPSIVPGGFPETPANEEDKTVSVNPLPAAPGAVNPITLAPGEQIPQGVTAQGVNDNVKLDKESYEKSDALPGVVATDLPPVSKNTIPESSLPIASKDATINTVGPGATTAALAGQVPVESKDTTVPEVVKESQQKAGVAPEASAVPEEVREKAAVEDELKSKVQEAPGTSEGHAGVGTEKQENTGLIAGAAATTGGAVVAAAIAAKDKLSETAGPTVNNATAAATDAANKNLPDSVKAQLPEAAQNQLAGQVKETTREEVSPQVPSEVKESLAEAGKSPEAAANTEAVVEKKEVESELLKEVKSVPAVDEAKPAEPASKSPAAAAAAAAATKPTETAATQGKATEANPEAAKAEAVKAGAANANGANGTESKPAESSQQAAKDAKKSRLSTIFSKLKEKLK
ncbi:C6 transcription factor [Purpureocillium lavendulum]|uniref:alpha-galactosidase n=1 Tax=Purpureocillium lavendulum TaxID=1247861 RepID=A0AB34FVC1_9HYPO|nr:C6 transcription factor [Purpureocillium lavendulum]